MTPRAVFGALQDKMIPVKFAHSPAVRIVNFSCEATPVHPDVQLGLRPAKVSSVKY